MSLVLNEILIHFHDVNHTLHSLSLYITCRYYSTSIFSRIGVESYVSTAIVGTLNFLTTILSIFLVDKVGANVVVLHST